MTVVLADRIALVDISREMPKGVGSYERRRVKIDRIFVHKSGADGPPGKAGAIRMGQYTTAPAPRGRGWPGAPYTAWIPRAPEFDEDGRALVYQTNPYDLRTYHTGGADNGRGVAVCLQGNYDGQWDRNADGTVRIERRPTAFQFDALGALLEHWSAIFAIDLRGKTADGLWRLSGHWESGKKKPVCPGDAAREWVEKRRGSLAPGARFAGVPAEGVRCSVEELNRMLERLGYNVGANFGEWDYDSRAALEAFQRAHGLEPDGWLGPETFAEMRERLGER